MMTGCAQPNQCSCMLLRDAEKQEGFDKLIQGIAQSELLAAKAWPRRQMNQMPVQYAKDERRYDLGQQWSC